MIANLMGHLVHFERFVEGDEGADDAHDLVELALAVLHPEDAR